MYSNNHYNKNLKEFARELRTKTVSKAEKYIWKAVLSRKQTGERFLRQRCIDYFIVDFFAPELRLIIEKENRLSVVCLNFSPTLTRSIRKVDLH
jgi:very-short-patch-repair endonuclease